MSARITGYAGPLVSALDIDFRVWCHKQDHIATEAGLPYVEYDELRRRYSAMRYIKPQRPHLRLVHSRD
jgi:hypothetical protein